MPALNESLDEQFAGHQSDLKLAEAKALADQCVAKLKQNPNDVVVRERLAVLLAENLDRADLAIDQIELLIGMPGQPGQKTAEWLGMIAAWLIKYRGDGEKARTILERLIREFPQSAQAFAAQRRLNLMDMESRLRQNRLGGV